MTAAVRSFDGTGTAQGEVELPAVIFDIEPNQAVMHQALVRQLANWRQGTADTKTRGEVSGGGRKPYRQKGTGRARHGSTREPSQVGGGVVFGPHPRSFRQSMPRKMRRLALRSALSLKAREGVIVLMDEPRIDEPKTKAVSGLLDSMGLRGKVLLVLPARSFNLEAAARNLPYVKTILARYLNLHDLMRCDHVVLTRLALEQIEEVLP